MAKKRILFLTGTRADLGKLKSLMKVVDDSDLFELSIFVTGMHLQKTFGNTVDEVIKLGYKNIYQFMNHDESDRMDRSLAKTIEGLSYYISENPVDLIVVHGDRVEALAGAIVGSLNNVLVAHIEGGEVSGTIDELIRHSVSKLSHIHLVANQKARDRLLQLGELDGSIHIIGSPDIDLMSSKNLPILEKAKERYEIKFREYSLALFHSVTTETENLKGYVKNYVDALIESGSNYIVIYPNNDLGSEIILEEYKRLEGLNNFKIFPSIRFEYFLTFLKNSKFIIGNSSAAVREAPYYNVPTVNIGTRQLNRVSYPSIKNCSYSKEEIIESIEECKDTKNNNEDLNFIEFGEGDSDIKFQNLILEKSFWDTDKQKQFQDIL